MTSSEHHRGGLSWRLRLKRWTLRVGRILRRVLGRENTVYVDQRVAEYRGYWSGAAARLSATFHDIGDEVWEVQVGDRKTRIANYVTEADDPVTLHLAGDKAYCIRVAEELGIPVAAIGSYALTDWDALVADATRANEPLVVKPASGSSSGLGITTQIQTRRELERSVLLASLFSPTILVERFVPAESCRLLFLNGEFIHAVRRKGIRVTGDGGSDIATLLRAAGQGKLIGERSCTLTLDAQHLSFDSVPDAGDTLVVRHLPAGESRQRELRTVYDETITDRTGPALRDQCSRLVRTLRCRLVGVDILTNNPMVSLQDSGGAFLEINTTPGIHHHYHTPAERESHPVAVKVLEYLLHAGPHGADNAVGAVTYDPDRSTGNIRG